MTAVTRPRGRAAGQSGQYTFDLMGLCDCVTLMCRQMIKTLPWGYKVYDLFFQTLRSIVFVLSVSMLSCLGIGYPINYVANKPLSKICDGVFLCGGIGCEYFINHCIFKEGVCMFFNSNVSCSRYRVWPCLLQVVMGK